MVPVDTHTLTHTLLTNSHTHTHTHTHTHMRMHAHTIICAHYLPIYTVFHSTGEALTLKR